jgi:hypothetical protein
LDADDDRVTEGELDTDNDSVGEHEADDEIQAELVSVKV